MQKRADIKTEQSAQKQNIHIYHIIKAVGKGQAVQQMVLRKPAPHTEENETAFLPKTTYTSGL